jgi:hypothetical protein
MTEGKRSVRNMGVKLGSVLVASVVAAGSGCWNRGDDCALNAVPCGSTSSSGSPDAGHDGGDSGPAPSCIPSENASPIADTCGVFVSSSKGSDATGKGTKEAPYQTLGKALLAAGTKPVYACGEAFNEPLTLKAVVELFGALDCTKSWAYDAANKTKLTAGADMIPVTLTSSAGGSSIHDFAITAADALKPGGSSIAILDSQADLSLENVDVAAGAGAPGAAGAAQAQVMTPASAKGSDGTDDPACNNMNVILGGAGGTNTCGTKTDGGNGGKGLPASVADNGGDGLPMMTPGNGGAGQTKTASCNPGGKGTDGMPGMPGTGAHGIGDVSASGYGPPAGVLGGDGSPGQGGGGGGAALACDPPTNKNAGPSGGGGGAGGCGGAAGNSGQSGGSSIGILAIGAKLTLTNVAVSTKSGGAGGLGGDGQKGAAGGLSGQPGAGNACNGGKGGQGGAGGPGGGGAGGHSIGIAIKGGALPDLKTTTLTLATGGVGGGGGDMDKTPQTKGDDGKACKTLDFSNATSCVM